jgi:hypothetical protein
MSRSDLNSGPTNLPNATDPTRQGEEGEFMEASSRNGCAIGLLLKFALLVMIVLASSAPCVAQTTHGAIFGVVADTAGGVVTNATVVLTNLDTAATRNAVSNQAGLYRFVNVPPARYRIDLDVAGFKHFTRSPIALEVQSTIQVDLTLQVGSRAETVNVTDETPLLQPATSDLGQVVDERKTDELPLNGRNPMSLAALVPSVIPQGKSSQTPTGTNPFGWGNYQIGGGMAGQSLTYLDGSPVNAAYSNLTALIPTQDSLQEFKVQTNTLPPEYGGLAGGVINFTTKFGANTPHGNAWEYLRNKVLNANTYYGKQEGLARPAFTQNQFGFNLGGPIYIPHIYNGHDKAFFFVNWEGFRLRQGETWAETVPTLQEREGDFSAISNTIYNPLTTCGDVSITNALSPACTAGQSQYDRTAFTDNKIPIGQRNQTALDLLKYYPKPNVTGAAVGATNYITNSSAGGNNDELVTHIDYNPSEKQHLSGRYTYWTNSNLPVDPNKNGICDGACAETFNTHNFVFSDTYAFSPTTMLDARVSYQRFTYMRTPETLGFDLTTIDQPSSLNNSAQYKAVPEFCLSGYDTAGVYCSQGQGSYITDYNDNDRIAGDLTKFFGNHNLKFGSEYRLATFNYVQNNVGAGFYYFDSTYSSANASTGGGGDAVASLLLGYPTYAYILNTNATAASQHYPALFANDDWRVAKRLTLNIGFRWEHTGPYIERHNRLSYFDKDGVSSTLSSAGLDYPGTVKLVNSDGYNYRTGFKPNWTEFSPRIGFAYLLNSKTVLQGGYGIFWLPGDVSNQIGPNSDAINSTYTGMSVTGGNTIPINNISNPYPGGLIQAAGRSSTFVNSTLLGGEVNEDDPNNPYAYAQQWNVGIQREVAKDLLINLSYAAAKGTHLPLYNRAIDQLPDSDLSKGSALLDSVTNPFYGTINSSQSVGTKNVTAGQLLRPYPQFNGVFMNAAGWGDSSYNSLQLKVEKRFSSQASILLAYTHAKLISDTDTLTSWLESSTGGAGGGSQDANNLRGERALSSNDVADRLVVSYILDLPFGRGKRFLAGASGPVNQLLGGWGVTGTTALQGGFPLSFTTSQNNSHSFNNSERPNVTSGCRKSISGSAQARLGKWFNTSCFTQPDAYTFGNESREDPNLRAAGVANWDLSAYKTFPFTANGKANLQFRVEAFNVFNRVQFGYPGETQGNSNFGVVSSVNNLPRLVQFALRLGF